MTDIETGEEFAPETDPQADTPDVTETALEAAPDLDSALSAAWDELSEDSEEDDSESTPDTEQADASEDQPDGTREEQAIPAHWSAETKAKFDSLTPEARAAALDLAKSQEADYTTKTQELAEQRREVEPLQAIVANPEAKAYFQSVGVTAEQAVQTLLQTEYALRNGSSEQKADILQSLATQYGVPINGQQTPPNQEIDRLNAHIRSLETRLGSFESQNQASQQQQVLDTVSEFRDAKDAQGNPLRPYFSEVETEMAQLITADPKLTLEQAYNKAIRINDEVAAKIEQEKEQAKSQEKAKAAQSAKRKASSNVKGRRTPVSSKPNASVSSAVEDAWEALSQA